MKKTYNNHNAIWTPHPGSQVKFLQCPIYEALIGGSRGGGKTDVLLMSYLQHVGKGYGAAWRGVIFREQYTQLTDLINKSMKWIKQIFPDAEYNSSDHLWKFKTGERLYFRYIRVPEDYWNFHGMEFSFMGWEELTNWATDECYKLMMSCNRCSDPGIPLMLRATCNPAGVGHSWVKQRFIDTAPPLKVYVDPETSRKRVYIPSMLDENVTLLEADPLYKKTLLASVQDDPVKYKAWVKGEWDIVVGGYFSDQWNAAIHVRTPFAIPKSWYVFRSFDWGSKRPWSVSYIAECNGEQPDEIYKMPYLPKGTCIVITEIYGWTGKPDEGDQAESYEMAKRILTVDKSIEIEYGVRVHPGPADNQITEVRDGKSISVSLASHGVYWKRSYKGSGSRVAGWTLIRTMLGAAKRGDLEKPHLYFFDTARHHIRTIPIMQHDPKKQEDIDSTLEDHACDSLRYGLSRKMVLMQQRKVSI